MGNLQTFEIWARRLRDVRNFAPFVLLVASLLVPEAVAKPMPPASMQDAANSPHIVVASYLSHEPVAGRSDEDIYLSGFNASYKIESVLKNDSAVAVSKAAIAKGKTLNVRYLVHDLSPCMADESFRFAETLMPSKGSKWILFLTGKDDRNCWQTYRGSQGRIEASDKNIQRVSGLENDGAGRKNE